MNFIFALMNQEEKFKKLVSHCREYGFVFQSSEIYEGLSAVYDYGQLGSELKKNIMEYWWKSMVQMHENMVGIDAAIFMHPKTWKASGHIDAFNDPLIDNKDSKKRYRADVLLEEHIQKLESKIQKEVEKAAKRFENFDEQMFRNTNPRVVENQNKITEIESRMRNALETNNLEALKQIIVDLEIVCPISGTRNWTDVRQFNLMFKTEVGAVSGESEIIYLRPETAQGIFVNFLNVLNTSRQKIPFGIAQIGKSFRNEIIARQFIFRTREFTQMEMQFFVRPGEEMKWYNYWKETRMAWHKAIGFGDAQLKFHNHIKLAHYANAACDIEFDFPFGFKEIEGIHSRTDFDLNAHQNLSGKKLQYFDPELKESYTPFVIETAIGLDRMILAVLTNAYTEEQVAGDEEGNTRVVLKIHPVLSPIKIAILPLVKKDGLAEKAQEIFSQLKYDFNCTYDEKDSIGRRYRRQDAIGTPYCITIDHQSLQDNTVTIRERDSMKQERIAMDEIHKVASEKVGWKQVLK